ncbi:MAG: T9SS type A sorting domain-containing protein [Bacteroidales bacterium]
MKNTIAFLFALTIGMMVSYAQTADFCSKTTAKTNLNISHWTTIDPVSETIKIEGSSYEFVAEEAKLSPGTNVTNHITDDVYFSSTATILKGSLCEDGKVIGTARFAVVGTSLAGMAEIDLDTYKYRPDSNGNYFWEKQAPFKCGTECNNDHEAHQGSSSTMMNPMDNCSIESIQDVAFVTDDLYASYGSDLDAILAEISLSDSWAFDTMEDSGFPDIQFYQESVHVVDFLDTGTLANYQPFTDSLYVSPAGTIATIAQNATTPIMVLYCVGGGGAAGVASANTYPMPPGQYYDVVLGNNNGIGSYVKIHEYGHSLWGGHHEDQAPNPVIYRRAFLGTDATWGNYVTTMGQGNFGGGVRVHRFSDDDPTASWYSETFEHTFSPMGNADRDMCRRITEEWNRPGIVQTIDLTPQTPTISSGGPTTFCNGGNVVLSVDTPEAGVTYHWSNGSTGNSITVTSSGNYDCYGQNGDCTGNSSNTISVTVHSVPNTPVISANDPTLCAGEICTISVNTPQGGVTYHWSNGSTGNSIDVTEAGTYTCYGDNGDCQSGNSNAITVTVTAIPQTPTISAGGPTTFCSGENVVLSVDTPEASVTYHWSNGATGNSITVTTTGNYDCYGQNGTCTGDDSNVISVTVNPTPNTPVISANDPTLCAGEICTLTVTNAQSGVTYHWSNGSTGNSMDVTEAGTYTCYGDNGDCQSDNSNSITVTVTAIPTQAYIYATGPTEFCEGEDVTLEAETAGHEGETCYWSTGETGNYIIVASPGSYTAHWENGECIGEESEPVFLTMYPSPTSNAGPDQSILYGTTTTLSGSGSGGTGFLYYFWMPDGMVFDPMDPNTATVNLTAPITFILEVTDENGCADMDDVFIDVTGGPLGLNPGVTPDATCGNTEVQLSANAFGGSENYSYTWSSDPAGFTSSEENPTDIPMETTTYYCEVNDGNFTETGQVIVEVYEEPIADAGPDAGIYVGETTQLEGEATGGSGDVSILWEGVNNSIPISNAAIANPTVGPFPLADVYYFAMNVTDNVTNCVNVDTVMVDVITGIAEKRSGEPIIYPNPTTGFIVVIFGETPDKIKVVNVMGKEIFSLEPPQAETRIDLGQQPNGLYFIEVYTKDGFTLHKVVKSVNEKCKIRGFS